jgi:hypothetical protein
MSVRWVKRTSIAAPSDGHPHVAAPSVAARRVGAPIVVRTVVACRRALVRRPWLRRALVVGVAVALAASMLERADRVDRARDAWGDQTTVLVATRPMAPGDPVQAEPWLVPVALAPPGAVADAGGRPVRQFVGTGEILTDADLAVREGPLALVPGGWVAVPVVESPRSFAEPGESVLLVSDGVVLADDAIVVSGIDDVTLVAVRADVAPLVSMATDTGRVTVVRAP